MAKNSQAGIISRVNQITHQHLQNRKVKQKIGGELRLNCEGVEGLTLCDWL